MYVIRCRFKYYTYQIETLHILLVVLIAFTVQILWISNACRVCMCLWSFTKNNTSISRYGRYVLNQT